MSITLDLGTLGRGPGFPPLLPEPQPRRRSLIAAAGLVVAAAVVIFSAQQAHPVTAVAPVSIPALVTGLPPATVTAALAQPQPVVDHLSVAAAGLPTAPPPVLPFLAAATETGSGLSDPLGSLGLPAVAAIALAVGAAAAAGLRLFRRERPAPWEVGRVEGEVPSKPPASPLYSWGLWPSLPLQPYGRKVTLETEVVPGSVWMYDQVQGTVNVMVPVRQTVIRLKEGGLFVHNPVAPTKELIQMMRRLEEKYGPVKHIVLGSLALEHKVPAAPFSRRFRQAQVWVMPGQYSFPLNLPNLFLGFRASVKVLPFDPLETPFGAEIDYAVLGPLKFPSIGAFGEVAFYHKASRSLLVTDAIVRVDDEPPKILTEDPRALLFHARDDITEEVVNDAETRRRGWRRIVQFGLNFLPSALDVVPAVEAIRDIGRQPESSRGLGGVPFGLTPWRWARDDRPSFRALQGGLLVAPILRELILNRFPREALAWADRVAQWPFQRIIPCHLANDLRATPAEFRAAFNFLEENPASAPLPLPLPVPLPLPSLGRLPGPLPEDGKLLRDANKSLIAGRVLPPPSPRVRRASA